MTNSLSALDRFGGDTASDTVNETLILMLQHELEIKNKQIDDLSAALVAAQQTAQAAQTLHAADKQQQLLLTERKKRGILGLFRKKHKQNF